MKSVVQLLSVLSLVASVQAFAYETGPCTAASVTEARQLETAELNRQQSGVATQADVNQVKSYRIQTELCARVIIQQDACNQLRPLSVAELADAKTNSGLGKGSLDQVLKAMANKRDIDAFCQSVSAQ